MGYNLIDMGFIKKTKEYENMKKEISESWEKSVHMAVTKSSQGQASEFQDLNLKLDEIDTMIVTGHVIEF